NLLAFCSAYFFRASLISIWRPATVTTTVDSFRSSGELQFFHCTGKVEFQPPTAFGSSRTQLPMPPPHAGLAACLPLTSPPLVASAGNCLGGSSPVLVIGPLTPPVTSRRIAS